MNAQQKTREALLEQNRAQSAIQAAKAGFHSVLQEEIERLKNSTPSHAHRTSESFGTDTNAGRFFRAGWRPAARGRQHIDPGDLILFPRSEEDYGAFLISQMRLNSELSQQLDAVPAGWRSCSRVSFSACYHLNTPTP